MSKDYLEKYICGFLYRFINYTIKNEQYCLRKTFGIYLFKSSKDPLDKRK